MRLAYFVIAVTLLTTPTFCSASSSYIVPTTTLAAQTSNNTSAANSFNSQSNGNRAAGNISKVDVHTLLYSGATTKVYAHLLLWFGGPNHMNVGYSSTNAAQVQNQIDDMVSRGIDGVIVDWYGPNNSIDEGTQLVMAAAESHPGFTFAIMIDEGAIAWDSCSGCSPQQTFVSDLHYVENKYFPSPAYLKIGGQPVITDFNVDLSYPSIDWNAANSAMSTHPRFFFQNNNGFTHILSDGSYSWVMPTTNDHGMAYLTSFYDTGLTYPGAETVGAAYKGFNDTLASWGSNRIMSQQCGQTWLETFSKLNSMYNAGKQLPFLQLVTWNDYEEATEIESGIDNCFSLSAAVAGNALKWSPSGNENTVDHYTVYISSDGQNLMPLTDVSTGIYSLNLCGFPIPNGNYKLFVQAAGKPSLANQISGSTNYSPSCNATGTGNSAPPVDFNAAPATVTIPSGKSGNFTVTAKPQSGTFNSPISLSCSGIPSTLGCSFNPSSITPGAGSASSVLTISASTVVGVNIPRTNVPQCRKALPIYATWLLPFGLVGCGLFGRRSGRRGTQLVALCAVISLGMVGASCGGKTVGTESAAVTVPASYSVTINGNSASSKVSTTVNIVVVQ